LALAARARLVGVTSLAAVAALVPEGDGAILIALDSRREDFYVQMFSEDGSPLGAPAAILPEELPRWVAAPIGARTLRIAGDAAESAAAALAGCVGVTLVPGSAPDALGVLAGARRGGFDAPARPLYLRPPDVSFPKARGSGGGVP
jgi:tRNA threonylcarbamoyladenosine biosynthesis protein TsaB